MPQDQAALQLLADRAQALTEPGSLWRQFEANDCGVYELQRRLAAPSPLRHAPSAFFCDFMVVMVLTFAMLVGAVGFLIA